MSIDGVRRRSGRRLSVPADGRGLLHKRLQLPRVGHHGEEGHEHTPSDEAVNTMALGIVEGLEATILHIPVVAPDQAAQGGVGTIPLLTSEKKFVRSLASATGGTVGLCWVHDGCGAAVTSRRTATSMSESESTWIEIVQLCTMIERNREDHENFRDKGE